MNNQRSLLTWAYYCQGKSMDELRQSLLYTTLELETTRLKAQEELKMRDDQLNHLKGLLTEAISERDQAQEKCHRLAFENILLQQTAPISGISSIDDEPRLGLDSLNGFSSDDCEESIVSSPVVDPIPPPLPPPMVEEQVIPLVGDKPWPEKGKFLQAVMKAGPLLQTLLLAGPLPQWRHPPPPIESYQIPTPPVAISPPPQLLHQGSVLSINGKRGLCQSSGSPTVAKHQKVVLQ